jgi:hypothetical protein
VSIEVALFEFSGRLMRSEAMTAPTDGGIRRSVTMGVWLYVEIALWMVVLGAVGSPVFRALGF